MTTFKIVAVSDTVCPWCYVGKQKLDQAIRTYKELHPGSTDDVFITSWMPFYLNPDSPKTGTCKFSTFLDSRFHTQRCIGLGGRK